MQCLIGQLLLPFAAQPLADSSHFSPSALRVVDDSFDSKYGKMEIRRKNAVKELQASFRV